MRQAAAADEGERANVLESLERVSRELDASYRDLEGRVARLNQELSLARSARIAELAEKEKLLERMATLMAVLPGGALRLLVTDQADRPQRHAVWVTVSPAKASLDGGIALDRTEVTDGDGVASFRGLPRGEYWVRIGAFTNRPTPPRRLRVYHPGGIHEQTVQMPGLAQLRLVPAVLAVRSS